MGGVKGGQWKVVVTACFVLISQNLVNLDDRNIAA